MFSFKVTLLFTLAAALSVLAAPSRIALEARTAACPAAWSKDTAFNVADQVGFKGHSWTADHPSKGVKPGTTTFDDTVCGDGQTPCQAWIKGGKCS